MDHRVYIDTEGVLTDYKTIHMTEVLNKACIFDLRERYQASMIYLFALAASSKKNDHRGFANYSLTCDRSEGAIGLPSTPEFEAFSEYPHLAELHIACYNLKDAKDNVVDQLRIENNSGWRRTGKRNNIYQLNADLKKLTKEFAKVWLRYETYRRLVAYELKSLVIPSK
jgi:hypothetical protein